MTVRHARVTDAKRICEIVNHHAERARMLHRSLESVYDTVREFLVAEDDGGRVVGCVAVDVAWSDLAEIKSLAVAPDAQGRGIGSELLSAAERDARGVGVRRLFALTYEERFFARHGFERIDRDTLPVKVWRECIACPRFDHCDEIAMMKVLRAPEGSADAG